MRGFRSSFGDWCAEEASDVPFVVAEMALAHQSGNAVERSYLRSDLFAQRRQLMDRWPPTCRAVDMAVCPDGQS